jgi:hypothetical protein
MFSTTVDEVKYRQENVDRAFLYTTGMAGSFISAT